MASFNTEQKSGSDCTGIDGDLNRVLTLSNTLATSDSNFLVFVSGLFLVKDTDYTVTHTNTSSTITFLNAIFDSQLITVSYYQGTTVLTISTVSTPYCNTSDIWNYLGKNAFTKVRSKILGTGNATTSTWEFDNDNVISGSTTVYADGTIVPTGSYGLNLNDGKITSYIPSNGVVVSADYNYADISDSIVADMINNSDRMIEGLSGRKFNQQANYVEYLDKEEKQTDFYLRYYPVITLTSVEQNTSSDITDTPGWSTSVSGIGNDYLANARDLEIGRFRFIDNFPNNGKDMIRVTYDYGYTSVPQNVKELSILLSMRQMINSSVYKSIFKGQDNFTPVRLAEIELRIAELFKLIKKQSISPI